MKPHILITNDDGILAPGLKVLFEMLSPWADVSIVAPASEKSGAGVSLTLYSPLTIEKIPWEGAICACKVSGTPADCVRLALSVVLQRPPDFILSGINKGSNAGRNILSSGTVGAAIEGSIRKVPSMALSAVCFDNPNYDLAHTFMEPLVRHFLKTPTPLGTFLNVNFPSLSPIKGIRLARQGKGFWKEDPQERLHPEGHSYYWLGGKWESHEEHEESDIHFLSQGYATVVPIHISELTDQRFLEAHKPLFEGSFN
jgi:5'-nucleotidase